MFKDRNRVAKKEERTLHQRIEWMKRLIEGGTIRLPNNYMYKELIDNKPMSDFRVALQYALMGMALV